MSGYLARLAARAGGAPAAAGPRLPSRFETDGESAVADAAAPPASATEPTARAVTARDAGSRTVIGADPPVAPRAVREAADATPPARTGRETTLTGTEAREAAVSAIAQTGPAAERLLAQPPATAAPPRVDATPPAPPAPAAAIIVAAARDAASVPRPDPDVVHVNIGRIDVRATVATPSPAPRAPQESRDAERSLHDYLAGRRR